MLNIISRKSIYIVTILFSLASFAQEPVKSSCSQKLKEMQKSYEQGVLSSIPDELQLCMYNGFTKTEKLQAYRLIILTYLFLDEYKKAEEKMNELLVYEPDYKPNKALDPVEFIKLYDSYDVLPRISIGISLGTNQSMPRLINSYSTGSESSNKDNFVNGIGFNFGLALDYLVAKNFFISLDPYVYQRNFNVKQSILTRSKLTSEEAQTSLNLPVTFKYVFGKKNLKSYARLGGGVDYLISAQSQMVRENTSTNQNDYAGASLDLLSNRNSLNIFAVVGGGVTYKLGYGFIFADARFNFGLSNFSKVSTRYLDFKDKITPYGYIDPDFGMNNVQISIGYMYSFYKVKKKKSKSEVE